MQFPTGGRVRERKLNRCDSGTDSIVWMEEDDGIPSGIATSSQCLKWKLQVFLFPLKGKKDIMTNFFASLKENLSFVLVCLAVTAALILAADLSERLVMKKRHRLNTTRTITCIAMFSAIAAVLHIFDFALPIAPSFYKLDLSELPVMICTFYLGPVSGVVCEFLKILLKLLIKGTSTAFVGDLANFLVGCSFVLPASILYQATLSKKGAIWSLTLGTLVMTVFGSLFNAWYLIPQFVKLFHMPLESIIAAGTAIFPSVTDLKTLVLFCIVPFNLIKGAAVSVLTFLLYKRVEGVFFRRKKNADSQ